MSQTVIHTAADFVAIIYTKLSPKILISFIMTKKRPQNSSWFDYYVYYLHSTNAHILIKITNIIKMYEILCLEINKIEF